jgi:SAM-dependent methyltransferase
MSWPNLRCPKCRKPLPFADRSVDRLICGNCSATVPVENGVPLFLSDTSGGRKSLYSGVAEATFAAPDAYSRFVTFKRMLFQDASLGVEEYTRNQHVHDVGCGPSLDLDHMENHHREAASYIGIDPSAEFVLSARAGNPQDNHFFAQAGIADMPFEDKSFDTTLVVFTIHHVEDSVSQIMREILRVTRSNIIIFDHLRSDNPILSGIQGTYWRLFDGGCNYMRRAEWDNALSSVRIVKQIRTGAIFGHVIKMACTIP